MDFETKRLFVLSQLTQSDSLLSRKMLEEIVKYAYLILSDEQLARFEELVQEEKVDVALSLVSENLDQNEKEEIVETLFILTEKLINIT